MTKDKHIKEWLVSKKENKRNWMEKCLLFLILWLYFTVIMPKKLEVLLINVCYASKKNDLPHKHGELNVTNVHNMNLHFPLSLCLCAVGKQSATPQVSGLILHETTFRLMAQSLGVNVFLLFNSVKQRSNQKLMGKNTSRMNIQS